METPNRTDQALGRLLTKVQIFVRVLGTYDSSLTQVRSTRQDIYSSRRTSCIRSLLQIAFSDNFNFIVFYSFGARCLQVNITREADR
jgi:hypothetical protein